MLKKEIELTKEEKLELFNKYNGHCAYCGKEMKQAEMRPDIPNSVQKDEEVAKSSILPTCRFCKSLKGSDKLERFRKKISLIPERLNYGNIDYRIGKEFGIIKEEKVDIVFYFEKFEEEENEKENYK